MREEELRDVFDRQARGYDAQWERMAPVRDGLYLLVASLLAELPEDARVLCVGVGTGAELAHLARLHPRWSFTAVEPSEPMLALCRERAEGQNFAARCRFHHGYLDSLPDLEPHDAATCFLVSQFIVDPQARSGFFRGIASRLRAGGLLASADLASDADDFATLLPLWMSVMSGAPVTAERLELARAAYTDDVAVLPPADVAAIIAAGGFATPVLFYQAGLLHAWISRRPG